MNIFRVFTTILYPFFIYLLLFSRRNLLESTDTSASHNPATDGGGQVVTTPANPNGSSSASGGRGNASGVGTTTTTPTSGGGTDGSGTKTGVDLSLKDKASTDQFDYNKEGKIVTFTAKGDNGFKSVKTGDKLVWSTTNSNEYANKVVLEGKGQKNKKVTIHLPNNTTKVFNREGKGKPWEEVAQPGKDTSKVSSGTKTGVDLSLKATASTDQFDHNQEGKIVTFTAKGDNGFKSVKTGDKLVWSTTNSNEYASKVILDAKGKKKKTVAIILPNNAIKVFNREGKGKKWEELDTTKVKSRSVNIKYQQSSFFYTNTETNNVRTFEAREGFHFNGAFESANNKKVEIWKTNNQSEYANKIVKEDNKVTFYIGEGDNAKTKVFTKGSDNKWTEDTKASTQNTANSGGGAASTPSSGGVTGTGAGGGTTTTTPTSGGGTDVSGTPTGGNQGSGTGTGGSGSGTGTGAGAGTTTN